MRHAVLYCTVLYCTILYCTVQNTHATCLCCTVLYRTKTPTPMHNCVRTNLLQLVNIVLAHGSMERLLKRQAGKRTDCVQVQVWEIKATYSQGFSA